MATGSKYIQDPTTISSSVFSHLLSLYSPVQQAVYEAKVKDPKKLATALKDHNWRYDELPTIVAKRCKARDGFLEKGELIRLTLWKITHGAFRPFLPGMVRKNENERVKESTASAFAAQSSATYGDAPTAHIPEGLEKALRGAAQLHGVGPATATLICSLYDPVNVPFFEDELVAWLCPNIPKVKYTWAEYNSLFAEVSRLRKRLGAEHKAVDVEKVAFVVGHLDVLPEKQRDELTKAINEVKQETQEDGRDGSKPDETETGALQEEADPKMQGKTSKPNAVEVDSKPSRKRKGTTDSGAIPAPKSKRPSQKNSKK